MAGPCSEAWRGLKQQVTAWWVGFDHGGAADYLRWAALKPETRVPAPHGSDEILFRSTHLSLYLELKGDKEWLSFCT